MMTAYVYSDGSVQTQNASGTYALSPTCNLTLTFAQNPSSSGTSMTALPSFSGLLPETSGGTGQITLQSSGTTVSTGTVIPQ